MDFEHLENMKTSFEDEDCCPCELHLSQLYCSTASELERQRRKRKWEQRAEEVKERLDAWMEALRSRLQFCKLHDYTESVVEVYMDQNGNLTKSLKSNMSVGDKMEKWPRKEEKESGAKEKKNQEREKKEKEDERKEKKQKKEREQKENDRKEQERKEKKDRKEREKKEKKERKEHGRK
ncbi:uncharacterized protein LOC144030617 [Festucalex cinctus]